MPKTDRRTTNVNIAYSTLDGGDNILAFAFSILCVCVSGKRLIIREDEQLWV